ncbi:MAG TPA: DUF6800 family protein [Candidatus Paceibacterota bacterium]|nr:DUF6800 family protein [Candidatus Paceibacterota bacterium]
MAKITAPNRHRFLNAKRNRRAKVTKLAARYAKAAGGEKEAIVAKALRSNSYLTREAFLAKTGK